MKRWSFEAGVAELLQLALRGGLDVIIEALDLHLAGRGVIHLGDELHELTDGIAGGSAGRAGMLVGRAGLEDELEALQPAQAGRTGRLLARDPDGVGDEHGVGGEQLGVVAGGRFEVARADLLLQLPQKVDVDTHAVLARRLEAPEGRKRRTFVVGRAAAEVAVADLGEGERIAVPRLGVARGGLHVEVVVDGDGRNVVGDEETAVHDRVALRLQDLRLAAEEANESGRMIGAAANVAGPHRLGRDAGDLDDLLQRFLEGITFAPGKRGQRGFVHGVSCFPA